MSLNNLFSPISIGTLKIQNRIVMPPMATHYSTPEGFVTDRQIAYYVKRAKGGVGQITTEHTGIMQQGKASWKMMLISTDEHAAKIKKLIQAVHGVDGKIVVQINHAGRQTSSEITGAPIVGASPIPGPPKKEVYIEFLDYLERMAKLPRYMRSEMPNSPVRSQMQFTRVKQSP